MPRQTTGGVRIKEKNMEIVIDKIAFELPSEHGFTAKAFYLESPKGDALIELYRDGQPYRRFLYPAYKVWNIAAHFSEIVQSEIDGNNSGYDAAGWTGFSVVQPQEI